MNAADKSSAQNARSYTVYGHPQTLTRKHVRGGAMLNISGCKFEQLIRDKVKAMQVEPVQGKVSVDIRYNADDQYIVDVGKSVLDGLNRYAYGDDSHVVHLDILGSQEIEGIAITVRGDDRQINIQLPVKAVGKQEPHSKLYAECGTEDIVLRKRLQQTADLLKDRYGGMCESRRLGITMKLYSEGRRGDIDNILKFYTESLSMAGTINKRSIRSISVDIFDSTDERVEITVDDCMTATAKPQCLGRNEVILLKVVKATEGNTGN